MNLPLYLVITALALSTSAVSGEKPSTPNCALNGDLKIEKSLPLDASIRVQRLSTRCADSWLIKAKEKNYTLPAGLRVVRLDDLSESGILFFSGDQIHVGTAPSGAWSGKKDCPQTQEKPSLKAFFEEARFALRVTSELAARDPKTLPQILLVQNALTRVMNRKDLGDVQFQKFSQHWVNTLLELKKDKVNRAAALKNLIFAAYNPPSPDGRRISEGTLIVPISQAWFQSDPKLAEFYQKAWLDSKLDPRIAGGASGEGVNNYPGNELANESFVQSGGLLEKTVVFLQTQPDLQNSPEAEWLQIQSSIGFKSYDRLIFFSPKTWINNADENPWADFVPVDQSLGGIPSDYLLSVMIHEINVNSSGFLPADTHLIQEESQALQSCVKKQGIKELKRDPATLQAVFAMSSQLSTVTLKILLDQLETFLSIR